MDTQTSVRSVFAAGLIAALAVPAPVIAGGISAGTLIENTATATFDDGEGRKTVNSNTVTVRVDELLDVTVTSLNSGPVSAAPGEAILTFEVTNQGNGPEAFALIANPVVAGNDFETSITSLAIDTNGNGVYDPGVDAIMTAPETTPVLAAEEAVTVFVIVEVPAGVSDTQVSEVELTANAVTGTGPPGTIFSGQGEGGGDAIAGSTTASAAANGALLVGVTSVDLVKAVALVDPFGGDSAVPGSVATFTLTANIIGSGTLADFTVTDTIPQGTTYVAGTLALDGAALTDAAGDDAGQADQANGISVALGSLTGGAAHSITFDVTID